MKAGEFPYALGAGLNPYFLQLVPPIVLPLQQETKHRKA